MNITNLLKRAVLLIVLLLLAACAREPEIIVVEITRLVPQIEEVEATRVVEKEVTRIVEVPSSSGNSGGQQVGVSDLDFLQVEFWPDYDRPSVLVLLTGAVPPGTSVPLEIAIPVPRDAEINAVAEIDENGMSSIDYVWSGDAVLFEISSPGFRIEYYSPYERAGSERFYDFAWLAPFSVAELAVQIQEPLDATNFVSEPAAVGVITESSDGLNYYHLDSRIVPRATPYFLRFSYSKSSDELTVEGLDFTAPESPNDPLHDQQVRIDRLPQSPAT